MAKLKSGGVEHKNFYENLDEARMRLNRTIITYDIEPYYVQAITSHKDSIFRMYLEPLADAGRGNRDSPNHGVREYFNMAAGAEIDKWMEANPKNTILRKKINSPSFNKFRPFPLGMINTGEQSGGRCFYIERQPQRQREQGLVNSMLIERMVSCGTAIAQTDQGLIHVNMYTAGFRDMIVGKYPSAKECLDALMDSEVTNEALAFHRLLAFVRGPLDVIYLGYKDDIVGRLPNDSLREVQLGTRFRHLKEAVTETRVFENVRT